MAASTFPFDYSNLKEAIDWTLRVTGKNGRNSGSHEAIKALSTQAKQLLREVKGVDIELGVDVKNVIDALNGNGDLITKLAEGLQQFIGYDKSGGTVTIDKIIVGKTTGGGILPANVAKYQVSNSVLNFVIRFLEGLCEIKVDGDTYKSSVNAVIGRLRKCVGTGKVPKGFKDLVQKIGDKVRDSFDSKINHTGGRTKTSSVFEALHKLVNSNMNVTEGTQNVNNEISRLENYIGEVSTKLEGDNSSHFATYCDKLKILFGNSELENKAHKDGEALTYSALKTNIDDVNKATTNLNGDINNLKTDNKFKDYANAAVFIAVRDAATAFIAEIKEPGKYTSYYNGAQNRGVNVQCAKNFLGCLPLYYQALTYIYWGCHGNGGGWRNLTLANGALKSYFDSQGLLPIFVDRSKTGAHIADSALKGFTELQQGMTAASSSPFTYSTFTKELQENVGRNSNDLPSNYLSALFYGASCYFRCQQMTTAKSAGGTPKTIREMLYFLAALQFSPKYDEFDSYVTEYFKAVTGNQSGGKDDSELKLQVAVSGSSKTGETLSAADVKSYLASTFHLPPAFIGLIQEPSTSGEPWLHSLFSNSKFNLSIPSSGAGIFNALSNYTYALQFQLSFLYIQCRDTYTVGCGWNHCTYGQGINKSLTDEVVQSHICPTGCTTGGHSSGDHPKPDECQHNGCGSGSKASPLQAFLTDKLRGFSRCHPSDPSSHLATCAGPMCHVPMGFNPNDFLDSTASKGAHISLALGSFCGGFNTPLRQLCEKLGCLTKRTPRLLGDLFGFLWHLNGQLFKDAQILYGFKTAVKQKPPSVEDFITRFKTVMRSNNSRSPPEKIGIVKSFESMGQKIPFLYQLFMLDESNSLPDALFDLTYHCHKWESGSSRNSTRLVHKDHIGKSCSNPNDLWSLSYPVGDRDNSDCKSGTCGPYLYPLTHSDGATYAPTHASTYLSWVLYLSDDLQSWFQDLLGEFKNISCDICSPKCSCNKGRHGSSNCSCSSVVDCADVLPLLYRHGFRFLSAFRLKGMKWENSNSSRTYKQTSETKRTCSAFAKQLKSVISGNPLKELLGSIDEFLYMFRFYFLTNLSGFWTIYICLILYTFFFLLDTLHLRSHLKLTSSHVVPPLTLLTSGNPLPITKLTYIGQ